MIWSIAFDGMHRAWKWTHIAHTSELLQSYNIHNIIVRWEYYRNWLWDNNLTDPYSQRRQNNILSNNFSEKSNRINRELFLLYKKYYPNYLKNNNMNNWIIIQDRSVAGKYLFDWMENIDNNLIFKKWKNIIENKIIPELIFILKPTKEIILNRLLKYHDSEEKNSQMRLDYKLEYINKNYEQYYNNINILPEIIKSNIILVENNDTNDNKILIQQQINKHIKKYLFAIFWLEVYDTGVKKQNQ